MTDLKLGILLWNQATDWPALAALVNYAARGRQRDRRGNEVAGATTRRAQKRGGGEEARDDGGLERRMHPPAWHEHESTQDHARHGPDRVRRVEPPDLPPDLLSHGRATSGRRREGTREGRSDEERCG